MKRSIIFLALLITSVSFAGTYSGGDGSSANPYQIANPTDLLVLAADTNDYNKAFILVNDINLAGYAFDKAVIAPDISSSSGFQGTVFTGTFDGNGHKITHFTIDGGSNNYYYLGLFGQIGGSGSVKNLGIENCTVEGVQYVSGLVGYNNQGNISNCYSIGTVSGYSSDVGGLVGYNKGGNISNCYSISTVSGYPSDVGGLVGYNNGGNIINCYSTGSVTGGGSSVGGLVGYNNSGSISNCYSTGNVSGDGFVGGLVGYNNGGSISNCYSTGNVTGRIYAGGLVGRNDGNITACYTTGVVSDFLDSRYVGGLVGYNNSGSISNCYSTGNVTGRMHVGGLVGINHGNIINCYSTGAVSGGSSSYFVGGLAGQNISGIINCYSTGSVTGGRFVGGLVGRNGGSISNCYSTGNVSGYVFVGGLVGYNDGGTISNCYFLDTAGLDNDLGEPLTDAQMKQETSFTGWDFSYEDGNDAVWFMPTDKYPILTWQISDSDLDMDGENNFNDFTIFARYWLRENCRGYNHYCEFADIDADKDVDIDDLAEFMSYWLEKGIY